MQKQLKHVGLTLLVAIISGLLFYGGDYIYQTVNFAKPVSDSVTQIEAVKDVEVKKEDGQFIITVDAPKVKDLEELYYQVDAAVKSDLQKSQYTIQFVNHNPTGLNDYWDSIEPLIYEGINQNQFSVMMEKLATAQRPKDINANFWLDEQNLYVLITRGKTNITQVIPLQTKVSLYRNPKKWGAI